MRITTREGAGLTVMLSALQRFQAGHPEPIVEFRCHGGILCSSYYISTFQAIQGGLCLEGDRYMYQSLDAGTVEAVKTWIKGWGL